MPAIQSFSAIVNQDTHSLILGSMPGKASLDAGQYYAHPRNAFWPIVGEILSIEPAATYKSRLTILEKTGIGLWDVLAQCERDGSLDSNIKKHSVIINNFADLFLQYPRIKKIFFNGATAESYFQRYVLPTLSDCSSLTLQRLPSTSPAHASQSFNAKLSAWENALKITN